jgi:hypothetical protein
MSEGLNTLSEDWERVAAGVMSGASGRRITRVLLDFAVTLQIWDLGRPTVEFKLEGPFYLIRPSADPLHVDPEQLGLMAVDVAGLFGAELGAIDVGSGGVLRLSLADGRTIQAPPDKQYESWSYASDDGGKVFCLASGGLSVFSPTTESRDIAQPRAITAAAARRP